MSLLQYKQVVCLLTMPFSTSASDCRAKLTEFPPPSDLICQNIWKESSDTGSTGKYCKRLIDKSSSRKQKIL